MSDSLRPMNCSTPGLPVHHQLPESTQTHVQQASDAIQPSHLLSSPSPPALNLSQHQDLSKWVCSSHLTIQRYFEVIRGIWTWIARCDNDVEMMLKHNDLLEMHTVFTGGMIGYLGFALKDSRSKKAKWRWEMAEATLTTIFAGCRAQNDSLSHFLSFYKCSFLNKTLKKSGLPEVLYNISKGNYCWGVALYYVLTWCFILNVLSSPIIFF